MGLQGDSLLVADPRKDLADDGQETDQGVAERMGAPEIAVTVSRADRTVTIEDNGIGMTREEATRNLGTIAHSGTLEFLKRAKTEPEALHLSPVTTPIGRPDEVGAARNPILRHEFAEAE